MLKTSGLAKSGLSRVHSGAFNPMTVSPGSAQALQQKSQPRTIHKPPYVGTGADYVPSSTDI
ncbi:MAG: hypothetical protein M0Z55_01455 [Peptococcaceae bacterium]|nr:hypothetical protein [Peptococcaceae bacterium]